MKQRLLLFLSIVLLLSSFQKSSIQPGTPVIKQATLAKACTHHKPGFKKPCFKKCIRHQNQPAPKGCATPVTDCHQQVYGLADAAAQFLFYTPYNIRSTIDSDFSKPLSPYLETEHAPPQLA